MASSVAALPSHNAAKLSSSSFVASGSALSAASKSATKSVKLVAFQVPASASDSPKGVRQFAVRGFQRKRAPKMRAGLQNFGAQWVVAVVTAAAQVSLAEKLDTSLVGSRLQEFLKKVHAMGIGSAMNNLNEPIGMG